MEAKPINLPKDTLIGTWRPLKHLGQGGQGPVWSVKPDKVKHVPQRALKACLASDEQARDRFRREVQTLLRCDSPHILRVYAHDLEWKEHVSGLPPFAYFVGEKCQGSMSERKAHLGDVRHRLHLFKQACAAVTYLHTLPDPVLHRDIKPDNFLIGDELANVILADFGIARSASDQTLTQVFEVVGTPYFRAPEMHHGSRGTVESDVYSLGRLLEWLVTGDVSTDMMTRPVPRGVELDDETCNALDGIIAKATQVSPQQRFGSARALADQIPDLWFSSRPRPRPSSTLPDTSPATVLPVALELARTDDLLGWRQLQNQLRRDLVDHLFAWRLEHEPKWTRDRNKQDGIAFTNSLLDISMGRLVFALAGVFSNNPALTDQRSLVEDFLSVPQWDKSGTNAIIEAPKTLIYVFQYLHGALCMVYRQPELALQLARIQIPAETGLDGWPLVQDPVAVSWPRLLGRTASWAWEFICRLRRDRPILEQFFALEDDYQTGLASYSMMMVLFEAAMDAKHATAQQLQNPDFRMTFLPVFIGMRREVVAAAARTTLRNKALVERIAQIAGTTLRLASAALAVEKEADRQHQSRDLRPGLLQRQADPGQARRPLTDLCTLRLTRSRRWRSESEVPELERSCILRRTQGLIPTRTITSPTAAGMKMLGNSQARVMRLPSWRTATADDRPAPYWMSALVSTHGRIRAKSLRRRGF